MASAVALPWAKTGPRAQAVDPVSGFGHGIEVVLILAGMGALALWFGNRSMTFSIGCSAAAWTALVIYELPGTLLSTFPISVAEMSSGAFVALTGSIVLALAALTHHSGSAPRRRPHRRSRRAE
jgi:hypothetical protein